MILEQGFQSLFWRYGLFKFGDEFRRKGSPEFVTHCFAKRTSFFPKI